MSPNIAGGYILDEAARARTKHPAFNSTHEGFAVLKEEVDEMWDAIKTNRTADAVAEAIQVGAMALRFVAEFSGGTVA